MVQLVVPGCGFLISCSGDAPSQTKEPRAATQLERESITDSSDTPIRVVASVPDLADIVSEVGGDEVKVSSLFKGPESLHAIDPRPVFVPMLNRADLYVEVGFQLEVPIDHELFRLAQNKKIERGQSGYLDASVAVTPLDCRPPGQPRKPGDAHPVCNPHYLMDPLNGLKAAETVRTKLSTLRPSQKGYFDMRYASFRKRLLERLLCWYEALLPYCGTKVIADHNGWPYFAQRFGLECMGDLEPLSGHPPTQDYLVKVAAKAKSEGVSIILSSSYYDPKYVQEVSAKTGAKIVPVAEQTGAREGTETYLKMMDYNVKQIVAALQGGK